MRIDNPYLVGKMLKSISPDSVRSGRTCPANLVVRSCPVRKLICPVRLSPILGGMGINEIYFCYHFVKDPGQECSRSKKSCLLGTSLGNYHYEGLISRSIDSASNRF